MTEAELDTDDAQTEETTDEQTDAIESRDDIPDRDALVQFRRNEGLTNEQIADDHFDEFSSRQVGMFCQMYGIKKGWKDAEYLESQIENGVTPEQLAAQWPITEETVRTWMDRHDIEENPLPDAYNDAVEALLDLAEAVDKYGDEDDLADEYEELTKELRDDEQGIFQ